MFKNIKNNCVKRLTTHLEDLLMPYWNILREMYGDDLLLNTLIPQHYYKIFFLST